MNYYARYQAKGRVLLFLLVILLICIFFFSINIPFSLMWWFKSVWSLATRTDFQETVIILEPNIPPDFSGTWKMRRHGMLRKEIEVRDGIRHGRYISWDDKGKKREEGFYKNGKKDGKFILWYPNGRKWREWSCIDGKEHGNVTVWDFDGTLIETTWRYRNWLVIALASHAMDMPPTFSGTFRWQRKNGSWYEDIEVKRSWIQEVEVEEGVLHGRFVAWHDEKTKASEGSFKNGKPHGKLTLWYSNGRKRDETLYKDGVEHGKATEWDFYGNVLSVSFFYEGESVTKEKFEQLTSQAENNK